MTAIKATLSADLSLGDDSLNLSGSVGVGAPALTASISSFSLGKLARKFFGAKSPIDGALPDIVVNAPAITLTQDAFSVAAGESRISVEKSNDGEWGLNVRINPFIPNALDTLSFSYDGTHGLQFQEIDNPAELTIEKLLERMESAPADACDSIAGLFKNALKPSAKFSVKPSLGKVAGYALSINLLVSYTISVRDEQVLQVDAPPVQICFGSPPKSFSGMFAILLEGLISPDAIDHLLLPLLRNPANSVKFFAAIGLSQLADKAFGKALDCRGWKTDASAEDSEAPEALGDTLQLAVDAAVATGMRRIGAAAAIIAAAGMLKPGHSGSHSSDGGGSGGSGHGGGGSGGSSRRGGGGGQAQGGGTGTQGGGQSAPAPAPPGKPAGVTLAFDEKGPLAKWTAMPGVTAYDVELISLGKRFAAPPQVLVALAPATHDDNEADFPQARFSGVDWWSGDRLQVKVRARGAGASGWSKPANLSLPRIEPDNCRIAQIGDYLVATWRPAPGVANAKYEIRLLDPQSRSIDRTGKSVIDADNNYARIDCFDISLKGNAYSAAIRTGSPVLKSDWAPTPSVHTQAFADNPHLRFDFSQSIGAAAVVTSNETIGVGARLGTNVTRPNADWFRVVAGSDQPMIRLRGIGAQRGARQRFVYADVTPLPSRRPELPLLLQDLFIFFNVSEDMPALADFSFVVTDRTGKKTVIPAQCVMQQGDLRQYKVAATPLNIWAVAPVRIAFQATSEIPDEAFIEVTNLAAYFDPYLDGDVSSRPAE